VFKINKNIEKFFAFTFPKPFIENLEKNIGEHLLNQIDID